MHEFVPFNRPYVGVEEAEAVARALQQDVLRGDGPISQRVQQQMQEWLNVRNVFLTTSCTHALETAMLTLGIGPGDEVILPSFTFVSTANAVVRCGGRPVFAEIRPDTLTIDPSDVERRITSRTRAIIPVHYAGVACDMWTLLDLADSFGLSVVEDAAQGVDAHYHGRYLGTLGDMGCYSFHDTKNLVCGEGGALLINREDLAERAELIREKGTNRASFARGEVNRYTWVSEGSSYVQADILAAVLEAQLMKRSEIKSKRKKVWHAYYRALFPLQQAGAISLPVIPEGCEPNYHIFFFRVATGEIRNHLLELLEEHGIGAAFHYVPLHSSPFGRQFARATDDLHVTDHCSRTLIRLPLYPQLEPVRDALAAKVATIMEEVFHLQPVLELFNGNGRSNGL